MLKTQIGTTGSAPIAALNGQWDAPDRFTFTIIEVKKDAPFVAVSFCDDGRFLDCTPAFFMRSDVHVNVIIHLLVFLHPRNSTTYIAYHRVPV